MDHRILEYLDVSGTLQLVIRQMTDHTDYNPDGKLTPKQEANLRKALITKAPEAFKQHLGDVLDKRLPKDVLDEIIKFYKSPAGVKLVYANLMMQKDLMDAANAAVKPIIDELIKEELVEEMEKEDSAKKVKRSKKVNK